MEDLLAWLQKEKGSVRTFYDFQTKALALRLEEPEQAGIARLLADLAGRFADTYDGSPLQAPVGDAALARLIAYVERAVRSAQGSAEAQLAVINDVGTADLI